MKKLIVVLALVALCFSSLAFAEDVVDWEKKYIETQKELLQTKLELNRMTSIALNLQQDLLICNTFVEKTKKDRTENMTKESAKNLKEFNDEQKAKAKKEEGKKPEETKKEEVKSR